MSRLRLLSPDACAPGVRLVSPLQRVHGDGVVTDCSDLGKLEVRGEIGRLVPLEGEEILPLGPGRALLVTAGPPAGARERLGAQGFRVYDMSDGLAAFELEGEQLLRRLTELDLDELPAVGSVARGTRALVERRGGERFRLFVPRELGHFVAEVALDLARGVGR